MLTNILQFIKTSSEGTAIFGSISIDGRKIQTDFLIQEHIKYIASIPRNARVVFRGGLYIVDNVYLVPIMLRIGNNSDLLYETWWNYSSPYNQRHFERMAKQDEINLHLYYSNSHLKIIRVPNILREAFQKYCMKLKNTGDWDMKTFDNARDKLYRRYPTPMSLWRCIVNDPDCFECSSTSSQIGPEILVCD